MYLVHLPHHRLAYSGGTQVELWTPDRTTCISNCRANNSSSTSRPLPHKRPRPPLCPRYVATTIDPLYASFFSHYCLLFNFIFYILNLSPYVLHIFMYIFRLLLFARDSFMHLKEKTPDSYQISCIAF